MKSIRIAMCVLAVPILALAADPAGTKPAREPEPKTQTTVNLSSPRDTVLTLLNAKFDGDIRACAATLYLPKEFDQNLVTDWARLHTIPGRLRSALIAKFPNEKRPMADADDQAFRKYFNAIRDVKIEIDGNTAHIPLGDAFHDDKMVGTSDFVLVKIKDDWKIRLDSWLDLAPGEKSATASEHFKDKFGAIVIGIYDLIEPIIADIESGKIKTYKEYEEAMKRNR